MKRVKTYPIIRGRGEEFKEEMDYIVAEYPFRILVNDREVGRLLTSPKSLRELTLGYLFSEGIIDSLDEIDSFQIDEAKGFAYIYLKDDFKGFGDEEKDNDKEYLDQVFQSLRLKPVKKEFEIDFSKLREYMEDFSQRSRIFQETGGVHSCALIDKDGIITFEEDIGRHNALDKILGRALDQGIDLSDKVILTSGRVSSEIILKVARYGLPMIVSRSAVTSLAIDIARKLNIGLIGFVRGQKMNIYK